MIILFWASLISILFIYIGYGLLLWLFNRFTRVPILLSGAHTETKDVAIVIAAYNEAKILKEKLNNTLALNYPKEKIKIYVVTDGSHDESNQIVKSVEGVTLLWQPTRRGKTAAINRVMKLVSESVVVFTDANVMLNQEALQELMTHYDNPRIGAVSGEKRVMTQSSLSAASTEGVYWKYESFIKNQESNWGCLIGAAGELFSIRASLFQALPEDTLLDDFMISMNIIRQGYRIAYEPKAYACEKPSLDMKEEYKRKVRISAGGIQAVLRLTDLINPMNYGWVSILYFCHRVTRWILMPFLLMLVFVSNLYVFRSGDIFMVFLVCQIIFYGMALFGWLLEQINHRIKLCYIPYYFTFMHLCIIAGWIKYMRGHQSVVWEKASRLA